MQWCEVPVLSAKYDSFEFKCSAEDSDRVSVQRLEELRRLECSRPSHCGESLELLQKCASVQVSSACVRCNEVKCKNI